MLTKLSVFLFVLAALLLLMACVKADRVRGWRESLNPSAPDIPDAAFVVARLALLGVAVGCVVTGVRGLGVEDASKWSDDELKSAVAGATAALDGSYTYGGPLDDGEPVDFDGEYTRTIEDEIAEHGGGDAPGDGVDAELTGTATADEARYRITASGSGTSFCMHVKRVHKGYIETVVPGLSGDDAVVKEPKYTFTVSSRAGEC
ncbi:hypothetical protein [Streptomyces sp.]|uniref:hypothetical protein n=1 Tax=Streptomyces sp. TaxID=1931 RepID=UPI002D2AA6BD|nr:hypothetical protein [Streptomyces sp.]HZF87358.1 hypothetical protein [Streptomyces sp.]